MLKLFKASYAAGLQTNTTSAIREKLNEYTTGNFDKTKC